MSMPMNRRAVSGGIATSLVAAAIPSKARALNAVKVAVLLPVSGVQGGIGQDCRRAVTVAPEILQQLGLPALEIVNYDTESNINTARARAQQAIKEGAQILIGAFDSGQTMAIAQIAEQNSVPMVINLAAAPPITEQGYKFVFRNFPVASSILTQAFISQKELFDISKFVPRTAVYMHVNDTLGTSMQRAIAGIVDKQDMPYKIVDQIPYDPAARDLSIEVAKAKSSDAEVLLVTSRLNDAILITRELIKQRWSPKAIFSMGPGWYEDQYIKTLGKWADGPVNFGPSYDPQKKVAKQLIAAMAKHYPGVSTGLNHVFTFEALLVAADAVRRGGSADAKTLAAAIRATNIVDNVAIGPGIRFNAKGQNDQIKGGATQIQGGKQVTIAPRNVADGSPVLPMIPYIKRS